MCVCIGVQKHTSSGLKFVWKKVDFNLLQTLQVLHSTQFCFEFFLLQNFNEATFSRHKRFGMRKEPKPFDGFIWWWWMATTFIKKNLNAPILSTYKCIPPTPLLFN